jgi:hypothetical protein
MFIVARGYHAKPFVHSKILLATSQFDTFLGGDLFVSFTPPKLYQTWKGDLQLYSSEL